jgi:hypothetical protein
MILEGIRDINQQSSQHRYLRWKDSRRNCEDVRIEEDEDGGEYPKCFLLDVIKGRV